MLFASTQLIKATVENSSLITLMWYLIGKQAVNYQFTCI